MICTFLGEHKNPEKIFGMLEWFITSLAMNPKIHNFYIGNHSPFEKVVLEVFRELKRKYATIPYTVILTPANESHISETEEVFWLEPDVPEGLETSEYDEEEKAELISLRNQWLVENADMIVYSSYVTDEDEDWIARYAEHAGKEAMNIAYDEYFV